MTRPRLSVDPDYPTYAERHQLREQYIREVMHTLNQHPNHHLIAITLKPVFSTSEFWNKSHAESARYVGQCYQQIERQVNSIIVKNHQRANKQHLLLKSHQFVEITNKDNSIECPHSHGILMIHPDVALKFESLLVNPTLNENTGVLSYDFKYSLLKGLSNQVHSVKLHYLSDVNGWMDYSTKQIARLGYPNAFTTGLMPAVNKAA